YCVKVHERPSTCRPGSAQTASDPWELCLRSQAPARNAARRRPYLEKHTMTRATAYQKRHAKARQRRRRTAAERLQRDRRQAQHAAKVLEQALEDLALPGDLVAEIEGRLRSQHKLLGKNRWNNVSPAVRVPHQYRTVSRTRLGKESALARARCSPQALL